jgi:hypothetical protein
MALWEPILIAVVQQKAGGADWSFEIWMAVALRCGEHHPLPKPTLRTEHQVPLSTYLSLHVLKSKLPEQTTSLSSLRTTFVQEQQYQAQSTLALRH